MHSDFSRILRASVLVLVALLAVAPALHLASDLGPDHHGEKGPVHGSLGKVPWASESRLFRPLLEVGGLARLAEPLHRWSVAPESLFVPPRR